ncbi:L-proline glycine betaine binding ABC transporter protein ProX [Klebsiella pneumoniae]|uniref:L-proline glycine betaine binding ABC transporter protein ProX n=1 Tax=Klebsiella pneumoniae TaxID=573 RepID=A0A378ACL8_KLEPN|nr:L-proline glycine betaine binding ABC transporter protein ProX [Klebsiella pneumoniae]
MKPAQSTISEESFQTLLVSRALEKLGYTVEKPSEVDYNVAYTSIAAEIPPLSPPTGNRCTMTCTPRRAVITNSIAKECTSQAPPRAI